jgi:hypothetical protein
MADPQARNMWPENNQRGLGLTDGTESIRGAVFSFLARSIAASIRRLMNSSTQAGYRGVMFGCKSTLVTSFFCGPENITALSN